MVTIRLPSNVSSSVAGGGGGYILPIGLSTKMKNNENATFLALLALFLRWNRLKSVLKRLLKHTFKGGNNFLKIIVTNQ